MMSTLHKESDGTSLSLDILRKPGVTDFIETHTEVLNTSLRTVPMSPAMRKALQRSNYIFSGMKTFHELNEAFPSLLDSNGRQKPFNQFLNDVQKIHQTYNVNYLRAEYNFAISSARMAAKWEKFSKDADRYDLQYRTVGDKRVRPEHAELNGITLPLSDPFWQEFFPPLGWNCFVEGTPVLTPSGWISIDKIKKGDLIIGGSGQHRVVIGTHAKTVHEKLVGIVAEGTVTTCTENHRFFTFRGWIPARLLQPGDILIQVGKVSPFQIFINAICNILVLFQYAFMSLKRKRKTTATLTVDNKIKSRNKKINNIHSYKFVELKEKLFTQKIGGQNFLIFTNWFSQCTHAFGVGHARLKTSPVSFCSHIRTKKRRIFFKFLGNITYKFAVGFRLSLTHMSALLCKKMVYLCKPLAGFTSPRGVVYPLRFDGITSSPNGNIQTFENAGNRSSINTPMSGKPPKTTKLGVISEFRGIKNIHTFDGFNSLLDFLRKSFFHNRYTLVENKITKNKTKTTVFNLSIDTDQSYIVPIGITHNCRCNVVQVRKGKYPTTDPDEALQLGEEATAGDKNKMFRFNPGIEKITFPKYNPYTIADCRNCDPSKGLLAWQPNRKHCRVCVLIQQCYREQERENAKNLTKVTAEEKHEIYKKPLKEQFKPVYESNAGGTVERHLLADTQAMDYERVLRAASLYADENKKVLLMPTTHEKEKKIRKILQLPVTSNPDLKVDGILIDVKSPFSSGKIVASAMQASGQGSVACITDDHCLIDDYAMAYFTRRIFNDKNYKFDKVYFVVDGVLYKFKRPKK